MQLARGRAADYPCSDCEGPAAEWSQTHGTEGDKPEHYEPRCVRCHNAYDQPMKPRGNRNHAAKLSYELADEIRARYAAGGISIRALAAAYGVTYLPTWNIIHRKAWVRDGVQALPRP